MLFKMSEVMFETQDTMALSKVEEHDNYFDANDLFYLAEKLGIEY